MFDNIIIIDYAKLGDTPLDRIVSAAILIIVVDKGSMDLKMLKGIRSDASLETLIEGLLSLYPSHLRFSDGRLLASELEGHALIDTELMATDIIKLLSHKEINLSKDEEIRRIASFFYELNERRAKDARGEAS